MFNEKKSVLITGGTSGIGRATALLMVSLGYDVAVTGRRAERLEELAVECENLSGKLLTFEADVQDRDAMRRVAAETLAQFNRLDVLVANAGVGHRGMLVDADWEDLETVLRTNIDGVLHSIRACVPAMKASKGGHIITISSVLGPVPAPGAAIYSASKAAVDALARALRVELAPDNIHVTNIIVGQTHTEFASKRLGRAGKVASKFPTMTPEKVAGQIVRALESKKRTIILRWIDRLFVLAGQFMPRIMDRVLARIYLRR